MLDVKIGVLSDVIYMRAGSWFAAESTQPSHCAHCLLNESKGENVYLKIVSGKENL